MNNNNNKIIDLIQNSSCKDSSSVHNFSVDGFFSILTSESPQKIEEQGQEMAINLFHKASQSVPAYANFLKKNNVDPKRINTVADFSTLPVTTKKNYLTENHLATLNWNGRFENLHLVSVSSGSTGEPFFWPRGLGLEHETALEYEIILKKFFQADKKKTLFIIGYAMGMYVAGVFTLNSLIDFVKKGYPLTITSPGLEKDTILQIVKNISHYFDQTIIAAYPAALKDIIDKGVKENIGWEKYNLRFISGGEGFSEEFREYIYERISAKNYFTYSVNTYGSADAAILGHETPVSIFVRKLASENENLRKALFKDDRLPSLLQYYPQFKYFEEIDNNLLFTTHGGVPLVRYAIGDTGGIISFEKMNKILSDFGIDVVKEMTKFECEGLITRLPFVYLFGRADNTKIFYGANIYPEHIKSCLEQKEIINEVTGKYFADIKSDKNLDQTFYMAVELIHGIKGDIHLRKKIAEIIYHHLLSINDEYRYLTQTVGDRIYPSVELFPYGNPKYFSQRIKPTYVKK